MKHSILMIMQKKLLDAANVFAEKFSEYNLTRTLELILEDDQYLYG